MTDSLFSCRLCVVACRSHKIGMKDSDKLLQLLPDHFLLQLISLYSLRISGQLSQ